MMRESTVRSWLRGLSLATLSVVRDHFKVLAPSIRSRAMTHRAPSIMVCKDVLVHLRSIIPSSPIACRVSIYDTQKSTSEPDRV